MFHWRIKVSVWQIAIVFHSDRIQAQYKHQTHTHTNTILKHCAIQAGTQPFKRLLKIEDNFKITQRKVKLVYRPNGPMHL